MSHKMQFVFDLDGTVTRVEMLPLIATHFGVSDLEALTSETVQGNVPFMESFIRRVHILSKLPVTAVNDLLKKVELFEGVATFIRQHADCCAIATGNLGCWVSGLVERLGCRCYSSASETKDNQVGKITSILKKENIVSQMQSAGGKVTFIGDGNNDLEAMRVADVSIASGLAHLPAPAILSVADYYVCSQKALCRLLNQLAGF